MTRNEAIKYFRRMWRDMYEYIMKEEKRVHVSSFKTNWCSDRNLNFLHACPLCEYACRQHNVEHMCLDCPIDWGSKSDTYCCEQLSDVLYDRKGLWLRCKEAKTWQEQAALAKQISELPEREV